MKNNYPPKQISETEQLSYVVADLFNVWLNRRKLDFQICFCVQLVVSCVA